MTTTKHIGELTFVALVDGTQTADTNNEKEEMMKMH